MTKSYDDDDGWLCYDLEFNESKKRRLETDEYSLIDTHEEDDDVYRIGALGDRLIEKCQTNAMIYCNDYYTKNHSSSRHNNNNTRNNINNINVHNTNDNNNCRMGKRIRLEEMEMY